VRFEEDQPGRLTEQGESAAKEEIRYYFGRFQALKFYYE
jgi:hypothetical protein